MFYVSFIVSRRNWAPTISLCKSSNVDTNTGHPELATRSLVLPVDGSDESRDTLTTGA